MKTKLFSTVLLLTAFTPFAFAEGFNPFVTTANICQTAGVLTDTGIAAFVLGYAGGIPNIKFQQLVEVAGRYKQIPQEIRNLQVRALPLSAALDEAGVNALSAQIADLEAERTRLELDLIKKLKITRLQVLSEVQIDRLLEKRIVADERGARLSKIARRGGLVFAVVGIGTMILDHETADLLNEMNGVESLDEVYSVKRHDLVETLASFVACLYYHYHTPKPKPPGWPADFQPSFRPGDPI